ncbi:MAG: glycosyltransferase [Saccharofermentans sp.]|nr:glycosyltransferase [Saccharofermentans sp.]
MSVSDLSLSIVIPVYNVENYLGRCLDTLLKTEGIETTEIILVDDGSSDGSPALADDYASRYEFIKVIHKTNEGPSEARNVGMKEAKGEYIFFCDSDDEVYPERFAEVIRKVKDFDADIILWDAEPFDDKGSTFTQKEREYFIHRGLSGSDGVITGKQVIEKQLDACMNFPATVWLGLHRRAFMLDNNLYFEKGLLHEDELWAPIAILMAQRVLYIPQIVYRYRHHRGSITNPNERNWTRHIEALLHVYPELYRFSDEHLKGEPLKTKLDANIARRYLHMIYEYDFYRYGYGVKIDKKQLWRTSGRFIDKCRVILLVLNGATCKASPGRKNAN